MEQTKEIITASYCRYLVEMSKLDNVYQEIRNRAKMGYYNATVPYLKREVLNALIRDGFKIYVENGTSEIREWYADTENEIKEYEIDWEK